jgi:replicative DNA helicase
MAEYRKRNTDLFAEHRLLQALYCQPAFLDDPLVTEEVFQSLLTKNIYKSMTNLKAANVPFTRDALLQEFSSINIDDSPVTIDIITKPQNEQLQTISDIIKQLKDAKKRREAEFKLKKAAADIAALSKIDESVVDIKDLIGEAEAALSLDDHSIKKVMNFDEWTSDYEQELLKRKKGKQFWFHNFIFDELVPDGPRPGEIGIIASASGSGKTTIATCVVNDLISNNPPIPCMYFSLEMSGVAIMDRLISKRLEIKYHDIANPQKDSGEFDDIIRQFQAEKAELTANKMFRFSEDASITLAELRKHIKKFQADIGMTYCIVIIDLLSMIADFTRIKNGANFAQSIEIGVNTLSAMAKELGVHFIGILQLNRTTEAEAGKIHDWKDCEKFKPNRAQIKNANAWVERARYVLTAFRQKYYAEMFLDPTEYEDKIDEIEISVVKINNALCKKTKGIFNGDTFSIDPLVGTTDLAQISD